jgi:hypothetical protein
VGLKSLPFESAIHLFFFLEADVKLADLLLQHFLGILLGDNFLMELLGVRHQIMAGAGWRSLRLCRGSARCAVAGNRRSGI